MRILRIYTKLPPLMGGMEKHIYNLTKEQIKLGHFVSVYFNKGDKVTFRDTQVTKLSLEATKPRAVGIFIFYILICCKLLVNKEKYNVVHIHGDWSSLVFSKIIQKLTRSKVLAFSIHDDIKDNYIYKLIFTILLKQVDVIFSTGFQTAEKIKSMTGKEIIMQPSGINKIFFEPNTDQKSFLNLQIITVANLLPKKNLDLILDIAKELPDKQFIIVGDGKEREKLQNRIDSENISNLKLLGYKNPKELKKLYSTSSVFMLTSFKEGTPTAILEAMACGLPIVTSNAGGIENIIKNDINGFVIDSMVKQKYIKILLKFDANLQNDIYTNNIKLANKFSWGNVSLNITSILSKEFDK